MAMDMIDVAIEITIGKEGKYSNNPKDSGGETMWGITRRVAEANGYHGPMKDMPREEAKRIYKKVYFLDLKYDKVLELSQTIAKELFDTGVNIGPGIPPTWLQQCLNRLNKQGTLYKDLKVDGDIGPNTLGALKTYLEHRGSQGELVLYRMLNSIQGCYYNDLVDRREKDEEFIFGWYLNRVG